MFFVAYDKPRNPPRKLYASPEDAERSARRYVKGMAQCTRIWHWPDGSHLSKCVEIAEVLKDNLGRVWTEVVAGPGKPTFL